MVVNFREYNLKYIFLYDQLFFKWYNIMMHIGVSSKEVKYQLGPVLLSLPFLGMLAY